MWEGCGRPLGGVGMLGDALDMGWGTLGHGGCVGWVGGGWSFFYDPLPLDGRGPDFCVRYMYSTCLMVPRIVMWSDVEISGCGHLHEFPKSTVLI